MRDDKSLAASPAPLKSAVPEPWLRGTLTEVPAVARGVLHALELAREDLEKWCGGLTEVEWNARPAGLPSIAFQVRHIARSLDRLLTYAEGSALTGRQLAELKGELEPEATRDNVFAELAAALVGKKALPTTVGGLLVHVADHTQRHVGQAVTTAKVIAAQRG